MPRGKKDSNSEAPKRGGRKPMTDEQKAAAAAARKAEKEKADKLVPAYVLQYQGNDYNLADLAETAKNQFHAEKKRTLVTNLKIYIKPEENAAYYVINESFNGKIEL